MQECVVNSVIVWRGNFDPLGEFYFLSPFDQRSPTNTRRPHLSWFFIHFDFASRLYLFCLVYFGFVSYFFPVFFLAFLFYFVCGTQIFTFNPFSRVVGTTMEDFFGAALLLFADCSLYSKYSGAQQTIVGDFVTIFYNNFVFTYFISLAC